MTGLLNSPMKRISRISHSDRSRDGFNILWDIVRKGWGPVWEGTLPHIPHIFTALPEPSVSPPLGTAADPSVSFLFWVHEFQAHTKFEVLFFNSTL